MAVFIYAASMNAQYCEPTSDCTDGDLILNFTFAGIDNSSGCEGNNGYSDYTASVNPASVEPNEQYQLNVTVGDGWPDETVVIWIDYDDSGTFDEDEYTFIGTGTNETLTEFVFIDSGAPLGVKRMRVRLLAGPMIEPNEACTDFAFGETEDYLIEIGSLSTTDSNIANFNYFLNQQTENLTLTASEMFDNITIFNLLGQQVVSKNLSSNNEVVNLSHLNSGVYLATATASGQKATFKILKR